MLQLQTNSLTDFRTKKFCCYACVKTFQNGLPMLNETSFNSLHVNGRLIRHTKVKNILSLLEEN